MFLNENSEKYNQPDDINIKLKEHQLAMLNKALIIEDRYEYAIMRDKPGSGKTYVVLSMILEMKKKDLLNKKRTKTNVIVVPQNIYFQWTYSIDRLTDKLTYLKFVEYEHLLNLYNGSQDLYDKDIILVCSSFYNSLASTLTSLEINVDRLFIDEIDNVGNFINQSFNTKFIMFISASFSLQNNNGYYTQKLKEQNEEEITILCNEDFIDKQINLEDPLNIKVLCKNIYVDKILVNIVTNDELKNINACYYKLNDKNFNNVIAVDEKNLIKLIFNENKSVIRSYKSNIDDCENNINYYEEKLSKKEKNIQQFNSEIKNIIKIFSFKKTSLKITENVLETFQFYLNPIIEKEYQDYYDVIVNTRKTNMKEFKIYMHNLNEAIYNLYTIDLQDASINEKNIDSLSKVFKIIHGVIKNKPKEIYKLFDDIKKISETKNISREIIDFISIYNEFEDYTVDFYQLLIDLEISLKSDTLLIKLKEQFIKLNEELNIYLLKKDTLIDKLKKNDVCPVCYEIFNKDDSYYLSKCCNNNICVKCTEEWFIKMQKSTCIYCNTENTHIEDYYKHEYSEEKKYINLNKDEHFEEIHEEIDKQKITKVVQQETQIEEEINIANYKIFEKSKIDYLSDFIQNLKHNDYKVILFCDFNTIFQKLEKICKAHEIEFEDLEQGNMSEIEKTVCNYKYGNSKILFANSSLFSCGMNFENSSHIIFVHKMDEKIIDQTIGRAQRLGRQNRLNIIYLEYENEIIENQQYKAGFIEKKIENNIDVENYDLNNNLFQNINEENEIQDKIQNNEINNEELELPTYEEVIDVNLDQLIQSLV